MTDIAVDTSAIVELMIEGPQADAVDKALKAAGVTFVTPVARLEAVMVMLGRFRWERRLSTTIGGLWHCRRCRWTL